jgi:hypothetical protein
VQEPFVKWKASLSNGETFYEGKGNFDPEKLVVKDEGPSDDFNAAYGGLSPWRALVKYIKDNDLKITSLSLYTHDNHNYHLPSAGTNPQQKEFVKYGKPTDFTFFRASMSGGITSNHTVAEAIYEDYSIQLWVDTKNPSNTWCITVPKIPVEAP